MSNKCIDCGKAIKKNSTRCRRCNLQAKARPVEERFWEKVDKDGPVMPHMDTPCWVWLAYCGKFGYGRFPLNGAKLAHRVSWEMSHKKPIPKGFHVLHKCDNPSCVNPTHLFLGTSTDNMRDMTSKGRGVVFKGEQHYHSKLTQAQVDEIRHRYASTNVSQPQLAREYGVTQAAIWYVLHHRNWK